jgi:hypothetical protein
MFVLFWSYISNMSSTYLKYVIVALLEWDIFVYVPYAVCILPLILMTLGLPWLIHHLFVVFLVELEIILFYHCS